MTLIKFFKYFRSGSVVNITINMLFEDTKGVIRSRT